MHELEYAQGIWAQGCTGRTRASAARRIPGRSGAGHLHSDGSIPSWADSHDQLQCPIHTWTSLYTTDTARTFDTSDTMSTRLVSAIWAVFHSFLHGYHISALNGVQDAVTCDQRGSVMGLQKCIDIDVRGIESVPQPLLTRSRPGLVW
jgi:hypothetical protein